MGPITLEEHPLDGCRTVLLVLLLLASATFAQASDTKVKVGMFVPDGQPIQSLARTEALESRSISS